MLPLLNYSEAEAHLGWLQDKLDSKVKACCGKGKGGQSNDPMTGSFQLT